MWYQRCKSSANAGVIGVVPPIYPPLSRGYTLTRSTPHPMVGILLSNKG